MTPQRVCEIDEHGYRDSRRSGGRGFSAGWVLRDAQARGIPDRKAFRWSALQFVEWPLFLWLYRRARPKRIREPATSHQRPTPSDRQPDRMPPSVPHTGGCGSPGGGVFSRPGHGEFD